MPLELQDFTTGDTTYVGKLNANNAATETAFGQLETAAQPKTEKGQASGYASLGADGIVPSTQLPNLAATYQAKSERGVANGYASLGADGRVPTAQLPVPQDLANYQTRVEKGLANGYAGLDADALVPLAQIPVLSDAKIPAAIARDAEVAATYESQAHAAATYIVVAERGIANGVAALGSDGKVPAAQLPASATGDYIPTSEKGAANGVAQLDSSGKLPLAQAAFKDFQFPFFFSGKPGNAALMWKVKAAIAFTLPQNLAGSNGDVGTNPTATTTLDIQVNGVSKGSVSIATSGAVTFTFATAVSVAAGDVLKVVAQATADATCADISITLYATR